MSSDLQVTYADLEAAAAAARKAATDIEHALTKFSGASTLGGDDFTKKGEEVTTWYEHSRSTFLTLLKSSHTSFGQFQNGFSSTAVLFRLLDKQAAAAAAKGGH